MRLGRKIATAWGLLRALGLVGFFTECCERLDRFPGVVTRHGTLPLQSPEPAITVVVPTFNGGKDLRNLLGSLTAQKGCRLEILILDSGSTDDSQKIVAEVPSARWVAIPPNEFSHSATRNVGVGMASHPFVFLTVQDACLPHETWLAQAVFLLERESLGALAAAETPRSDADAYARYSLESHYRGLNLRDYTTLIHSHWRGSRGDRIRAASIGNVGCLYRREVLLAEPFEGSFGEDFILGMRLVQKGIRVGKTSELRVIHSHTRPALYGLKRMFVSRRLMVSLGLSRTASKVDERFCLGLVAGIAGVLAGGWEDVRRLEPDMFDWIGRLGVDREVVAAPQQSLKDILDEVRPYAAPGTEEYTVLSLKAVAGRIGWELGGIDLASWQSEPQRNLIETLAKGV